MIISQKGRLTLHASLVLSNDIHKVEVTRSAQTHQLHNSQAGHSHNKRNRSKPTMVDSHLPNMLGAVGIAARKAILGQHAHSSFVLP